LTGMLFQFLAAWVCFCQAISQCTKRCSLWAILRFRMW
jgi:hypothetical protein